MFAERFKLLREQAGLTQTAFARAFGVAQSTVAGWESGSREPNIATVRRLAEYFGVTADYLLGGEAPALDERLEAMHKNPKLGLLFDRTARMTPEDLDAVLHIVRQMQRDE